jgi:hypothetical protein
LSYAAYPNEDQNQEMPSAYDGNLNQGSNDEEYGEEEEDDDYMDDEDLD